MAKRRLNWNEDKYKKFLKEGRGAGIGKGYRPWVTVQDFPSSGRVSRIAGWKTGRIHHLLSDLQTKYFYMLDWSDNVVDIREHFPLLDVQEVIKDKEDLRFDLFIDKESKTPYVINTNFLITIKNSNGSNRYIARDVKMVGDLEKKKTLERLEIERRYWKSKEIDWGIVTNKEINNTFAKNIEWVHSTLYSYVEQGFTQEDIIDLSGELTERLRDRKNSIRKITSEFDEEFGFQSGTGLFVFKFLIASKQIIIDMTHPIDINSSKPEIKIASQSRNEEKKIL